MAPGDALPLRKGLSVPCFEATLCNSELAPATGAPMKCSSDEHRHQTFDLTLLRSVVDRNTERLGVNEAALADFRRALTAQQEKHDSFAKATRAMLSELNQKIGEIDAARGNAPEKSSCTGRPDVHELQAAAEADLTRTVEDLDRTLQRMDRSSLSASDLRRSAEPTTLGDLDRTLDTLLSSGSTLRTGGRDERLDDSHVLCTTELPFFKDGNRSSETYTPRSPASTVLPEQTDERHNVVVLECEDDGDGKVTGLLARLKLVEEHLTRLHGSSPKKKTVNSLEDLESNIRGKHCSSSTRPAGVDWDGTSTTSTALRSSALRSMPTTFDCDALSTASTAIRSVSALPSILTSLDCDASSTSSLAMRSVTTAQYAPAYTYCNLPSPSHVQEADPPVTSRASATVASRACPASGEPAVQVHLGESPKLSRGSFESTASVGTNAALVGSARGSADAKSQTLVGEFEGAASTPSQLRPPSRRSGAASTPSQLRAPSKRSVSVHGPGQGSQQFNFARGVPAAPKPPSPEKVSFARTGSSGSYSDMAGRKLRRNAGSPLASPNSRESHECGSSRSARQAGAASPRSVSPERMLPQ